MADHNADYTYESLLRVLPCDVAELLRAVVVENSDPVVIADLHGEHIYRNAAYSTSFGFTPGEPMDGYGPERFHPEDRARFQASVDRMIAEGHGTLEYRARQRDGTWLWRSGSIVALRDRSGHPVAMLVMIHDISPLRRTEEALRLSEERLKLLVESAEDVILLVDSERRVAWARVPSGYGPTSESLVGKHATDVFPPEAARQLKADGEEVFATGQSRVFERRLPLGGRYVWFHNLVYPMRDAEGRVTHVGWICRNITDLKAAQEALQQERETSRRYFDIAAVIMGTMDTTGRIMLINQRGAEVLGRPASELVGQNLFDLCVPERYREEARAGFLRVMAGEDLPFEEYELPIVTASGEERIVTWRTTLLRDHSGRITGALSSGEDVTDRYRVEEALRRSETRYRGIVEDQTEFICRFTKDGVVTFVNQAVCRMAELPAEQLVGRNFFEFISPGDRERVRACIASLNCDNPVAEIEDRDILPNGEVRWQQWVNRAICDGEGRVVEYQGVGRDVTDLKHAQELLIEKSRMETASTMAGGIAHDFNNLMVAVLGNAELLRSEVANRKDALEMLDAVTRSARRASDLAQKLLAFARGGKYRPQPVNLNEVVTEALQIQGRTLPAGVRVDLSLGSDLANVEADRTQMSQVVMNLLLNAVEAVAPRGHVSIATANSCVAAQGKRRADVRPGACVRLTVADSGPGMDAETLSHVFQPFFTTKGPGRGLGLPAVFGIIKNHGGDVTVESARGKGTTFVVCLPSMASAERNAKHPQAGPRRDAETILVVDDEPSVLDVTRRMLERRGYRVLTAESGTEAIRLAKEHPGDIDLVLLDIGMPGMDGAEAFPLLREARPAMKIVISSGYDRVAASDGLLKAGACGFVQKPFVSDELAREIRAALDST